MEKEVWIARDGNSDIYSYSKKPEWSNLMNAWMCFSQQQKLDKKEFAEIKPGECVKFKITFERIEADESGKSNQ